MKIKTLTFLLLMGLVIFGSYLAINRVKQPKIMNKQEVVTKNITEDTKADLNGDGNQETMRLTYFKNDTESSELVSLIVLDTNNKEIARLPDSTPIMVPFTNSGVAYTPVDSSKVQFVAYDFVVGPHSTETMFFALLDNPMEITPVCLSEKVSGPEDCLFWSGEGGQLVIKDLDNDGNIEVVESVDEYPKDGPITNEIEKLIDDNWKELGSEAIVGAKRVLRREQGGRGNKVIWGIYRFNGNYFEEQTGVKYNKYYDLVKKYLGDKHPEYPKLMKRTEMSKDSLDYNVFMRKFWTKR